MAVPNDPPLTATWLLDPATIRMSKQFLSPRYRDARLHAGGPTLGEMLGRRLALRWEELLRDPHQPSSQDFRHWIASGCPETKRYAPFTDAVKNVLLTQLVADIRSHDPANPYTLVAMEELDLLALQKLHAATDVPPKVKRLREKVRVEVGEKPKEPTPHYYMVILEQLPNWPVKTADGTVLCGLTVDRDRSSTELMLDEDERHARRTDLEDWFCSHILGKVLGDKRWRADNLYSMIATEASFRLLDLGKKIAARKNAEVSVLSLGSLSADDEVDADTEANLFEAVGYEYQVESAALANLELRAAVQSLIDAIGPDPYLAAGLTIYLMLHYGGPIPGGNPRRKAQKEADTSIGSLVPALVRISQDPGAYFQQQFVRLNDPALENLFVEVATTAFATMPGASITTVWAQKRHGAFTSWLATWQLSNRRDQSASSGSGVMPSAVAHTAEGGYDA